MKRLNDTEKKQLGVLINYYRNAFFRSNTANYEDYKQINFCRDICSQSQLSRLENGEVLREQDIYYIFLNKLNLSFEKVPAKDYSYFTAYVENIWQIQNNDNLTLNYNEYILVINKYQNIFKKNILYTHYNYVLEFILLILDEDLEEATYLLEDIENTTEILYPKLLILCLQHLGKYYHRTGDFGKSNKYYLLAIEHMYKNKIDNPIIYVDTALNNIKMGKYVYALDYLHKAHSHFTGSDNYRILGDIYSYYGLLYLYRKYFDDAINAFFVSLGYGKKINKPLFLQKQYLFLSAGFYVTEDYRKSEMYLAEAEKVLYEQIKRATQHKSVWEFYRSKDDNIFQINLKNIPGLLPEYIRIIFIYDLYEHYKKNKKYKKALEITERYF